MTILAEQSLTAVEAADADLNLRIHLRAIGESDFFDMYRQLLRERDHDIILNENNFAVLTMLAIRSKANQDLIDELKAFFATVSLT